jgi:hypothetical protein
VIDQHAGRLGFADRELRQWQRVLENRITWLERQGIAYFFLVPPNAHSVYPEDLPTHVETAPRRPIHQLMDHLEQSGSFARLIYPLDEIVSAKGDSVLYPLTDAHWGADAAFIAYTCVAREIAKVVSMNQVQEKDVAFRLESFVGELGFKVKPQASSERVLAHVGDPQALLVSDNLVLGRGNMFTTTCPGAPDTSCLMLGDSFSGQLWTFFAASFRHLAFAQIATLDYELVERERPDVVVSALNERFLIRVPDDLGGETARELEARKLAEEQTRARMLNWPAV